MKTRAALLMQQPGKWEVVETELDDPAPDEVLVRMVVSGLCHSDDHVAKADGKIAHFPYCGGHEGAGVVEAIGSAVAALRRATILSPLSYPVAGGVASAASGCRTCARTVRSWVPEASWTGHFVCTTRGGM